MVYDAGDSPNLWREEMDETWQVVVPVSCSWVVGLYWILAVSTTWHVQDVQGLPQKVPGKSCIYWGHFFSQAVSCPGRPGLPAWNLTKFIDEKITMVKCSQLCGMMCTVLCLSSFSSSHVSTARLWLKASKRTPPWRTCVWEITTSVQKGLRLGVWWGWGYEGISAVKKYRKEGSRPGRVVLPAWNLNFWMRRTVVRFSHVCGMMCTVLCLSSCPSSHVSPARLWPRPWNRTPPWARCIWGMTPLALKGRRLGVWSVRWGWCHGGEGAKKGTGRIKTQPFEGKHAVQRWISGAYAQKGAKKVCLRKRVSMSFPSNKLVKICKNQQPRKSKETDSVGLYINKQVACLRYLTLFSFLGELRPPYCLTKLEDYLRCVKIMFSTKAACWTFLRDAGTAGVEQRKALEMIEEALERNKSKQPRQKIFRVVRNLPTKSPWWWWAFGLFLQMMGVWAVSDDLYQFPWNWMKGFVQVLRCCLDLLTSNGNQAAVKHGFLSKVFTSYRHFCYLFFKHPTVPKRGPKQASQFCHWCRDWRIVWKFHESVGPSVLECIEILAWLSKLIKRPFCGLSPLVATHVLLWEHPHDTPSKT